ncbi:MAG: lysine--tRNA ligase [Tissierellia bacterium]|nr:lysine--tRNA ligase [Tissierellia bacterium]
MSEELNLNEMLQIRRDKLDSLIEEDKDPHKIGKFEDRVFAKDIQEKYEEYEGSSVRVAGRIMSRRGHGKVNFMHLQDSTGRIQLFNRLNELGEEEYEEIKKLDIGDIVGAEGEVFTTKTGEISIRTKKITLLTKSLQILPEKFHGLVDPDLRYRQRYVDLIVNPEVKDVFIMRNKIIKSIRRFLDDRGFLEVETPILNTIAGGAVARPFITHHNTLDIDMYLRIANELYLKRLIVGGFEKVYEMGRMFRNEGMDSTHNPEYTAVELYAAYEDYEYMMELTEELVHYIVKEVRGSSEIEYQGNKLDFTPPWNRMKMTDAIKEYTGIDFEEIKTDEEAIKLAKEKGIEIEPNFTRGHIISEFFEEFCEDKLIQPTFITHHPVEISPLSKRDPEDPRYTHRFEAFVNTKEIANAFSELNDARDQRERFEEQVRAREGGDKEAHMMDNDFINALEVGLPPTGGLGIGVDRLIMIITNRDSIRDVILFPTMKPLGGQSPVNQDSEGENAEAYDQLKTDLEEIDFSKVKVEPLFEDMIDFEIFSKADYRAVKVINCEEVPKSKKLLKFTLDDGTDKERVILSGIKENYSAEELVGKTLLAICNLPPRKMMGIDSEGMIISAIHDEEGKEKLNLIILSPRIPAGAKMY